MYNEYYPENTSPDCFENYGGHHIDDRMRTRGNSYAHLHMIDDKAHYATPETIEEKRRELESLQTEYKKMHESIYGENSRERMAGDELVDALLPLEALALKITNLKRFIATACVINVNDRLSDRVQILSKVTVRIQGVATPMTIRIVGENDANLAKREISCSSPVGKSLLGHRVGDSVDINVGGRVVRYNILSI